MLSRRSYAGVAELADVQDLGSCATWRAGSSPVARTKQYNPNHLTYSEMRSDLLFPTQYLEEKARAFDVLAFLLHKFDCLNPQHIQMFQ